MTKKYVITGGTGNIGHVLAEKLLAAGNTVIAIGRNQDKLKALSDKGALTATGDLKDAAFLTKTFQGADGVFAMIPPEYTSKDFRKYQNEVGDAIISAIKSSGVKNVVFLSSIGAHLLEKAGVVQGLYDVEQKLNKLGGVNIKILRPVYFMENLFMEVGIIKHAGIAGSALKGDAPIAVVATKDIAEVAANHLSKLDLNGISVEYILGAREYTYNEIAKILGAAIGRSDLVYAQFPYPDAKQGMIQAGMSENVADLMNELVEALNNGSAGEVHVRDTSNTTPTTVEEFAPVFAAVYNS